MKSGKRMTVAAGAVVTVAMRWIDRTIGFVSTLILARLLVPEDFGIVAQAVLISGLLSVMTDLGVNIALIQNADAEQADFDTAWTIRLAQYSLVGLLIFVSAPYAGDYFGDERIIPVLQVLPATVLLAGLENIGIITFQKEMKFGLDFRFLFSKRIIGFVVTMTLAFMWRDYWALIAGMICTSLAGVVLSYLMHPMRPRLSLARFSAIFAISQWNLIRGIGGYLDNNLDRFVIGGRASSSVVGGYTLANEIAMIPSTDLLAPLNRVLFPAFVNAKKDLAELKRLFLTAQGVQCLLATPACIGLATVAEEIVYVLLGEKWIMAVPFIQILALIYVIHAISTSAGYVLITLGQMRSVVVVTWSQVIMFSVAAFLLLPESTVGEIAQIRLVVTCAGLGLSFWLLKKVLSNLSYLEIGATIYRPLVAASLMSVAITKVNDVVDLPMVGMLFVKIAFGAIVYALLILSLWLLAGRPSGSESYILENVKKLINRS